MWLKPAATSATSATSRGPPRAARAPRLPAATRRAVALKAAIGALMRRWISSTSRAAPASTARLTSPARQAARRAVA